MSSFPRASSTLRSINHRLKGQPPHQLPILIPHIARSLLDCKTILSASPDNLKESTDGVALHTFKTFVTSLVNGKTPQQRWAGIVLVKAVIELGGLEILQASKPWINALISILNKPDSPSSKKLCILTLTRIFTLTHGHQTFVRELTTPSLPAFIQACVRLITPTASVRQLSSSRQARTLARLSQPVMECLAELVPRHPTMFRTYLQQLNTLLAPLLAPTPSNADVAQEFDIRITDHAVTAAAQRLHAQLHLCAKSGSSKGTVQESKFSQKLSAIIDATHATADAVLRSVIEDWVSQSGWTSIISAASYSAEISWQSSHASEDSTHLPSWTGIHAGCERLLGLLELLQAWIKSSHTSSAAVSMPIGSLIDLIVRITSVTVPSTRSAAGSSTKGTLMMADAASIRPNEQISHTEREALFSHLPELHVAVLDVTSAMLRRFGSAATPWSGTLIQQASWVFSSEHWHHGVRRACFRVARASVSLFGKSFKKNDIDTIAPVLRHACEDVLQDRNGYDVPLVKDAMPTATTQKGKKANALTTTINADMLTRNTATSASTLFSDQTAFLETSNPLLREAMSLITTFLLTVPSRHINAGLRSQLDRAAVLSGDKDAQLASVLNPPALKSLAKTHSSILPLLARGHHDSAEVECVIRPRLPVILNDYGEETIQDNDDEDGEVSDESMDNPIPEPNMASSDDIRAQMNASTKQSKEIEDAVAHVLSTHDAVPATRKRPSPPAAADSDLSEQTAASKKQKTTSASENNTSLASLPASGKTQASLTPNEFDSKPDPMVDLTIDSRGASDGPTAASLQSIGSAAAAAPIPAAAKDQAVASSVTSSAVIPHLTQDNDDYDDDDEIPEINMDPDTESEEDDDEMVA